MIWCSILWYNVTWCDMIWYCMIQYTRLWYTTIYYNIYNTRYTISTYSNMYYNIMARSRRPHSQVCDSVRMRGAARVRCCRRVGFFVAQRIRCKAQGLWRTATVHVSWSVHGRSHGMQFSVFKPSNALHI